MADIITLTSNPIRGSGVGAARMETAIDVLEYDVLDIGASLVAWTGASASITVAIITGMTVDTYDAWISAGTVTLTDTARDGKIQISGSFLRYIRWQITTWGAQTSATWWIRGMARAYSEQPTSK